MKALRRSFWLAVFLTFSLLGHATADSRPPNLLLIVSDDLGYADLGCFGGRDTKTPHLDRLAAGGIRATHFYVTAPACTPSRGSILTGRYPQRNGLYEMIRNDLVNYGHRYTEAEYAISPEMTLGMDLQEITIAQALKKKGYATGMIGKWDGGRAKRFLPLQRGFDFFHGFANTGIDYWTHERYGIPSMFRGNERIKEEGYSTDIFRREALHFVKSNSNQPFFLYLAFNAPHSASNLEKDSYQVPEKYLNLYPGLNPKDKRTKYMAMVSCMDDAIGEILSTLKALNLEENTLIMFLSDNGGAGASDNGPLRGGKAGLFEGGIRVPFIARWPGKIPPNTTSSEFLSTLELFPTLLSAARAKKPSGVTLDGFDMLPALAGKAKSQRIEMFWEWRGEKAVRVGDYKWLETEKTSGLFHLQKDPGEKHDISVPNPNVATDLKNRFRQWRKEMDAAEYRGPFRD